MIVNKHLSIYLVMDAQVSSGSQGIFAQDVVAINAAEKQYCILGELNKHAILTPDVDTILDSLGGL